MGMSSSVRARVQPPVPPSRQPVASPASPVKPKPAVHCPRCHTVLTDPDGLGLCPRCGFCRSLQGDGINVLAEAGRESPAQAVVRGLKHSLELAPAVTFALCVAFVAVVPLAYLADQRFPPGSQARAVWSAGSLFCGVLMLVAGQAWAVTILRDMHERVTWADMASPLRVWGFALRRLPATAWPVGLGASGALAILAAVVWVGGLSYWLRLDNGDPGRRVGRVDSRDGKALARVSHVLGYPERQGNSRAAERPEAPETPRPVRPASATAVSRPADKSPPDPRPTERCVIVGIVPAGGGQPAGLVLARMREGQLAFAGVVRSGLGRVPDVLERLSRLGRTRPVVEGMNLDAVWVRPEVFCEVHQSGDDAEGQMVEPSLKALIED